MCEKYDSETLSQCCCGGAQFGDHGYDVIKSEVTDVTESNPNTEDMIELHLNNYDGVLTIKPAKFEPSIDVSIKNEFID